MQRAASKVFALAQSMGHIGPTTRSAADAAAMLYAIAGADPNDTTAAQEPVLDYLAGILRRSARNTDRNRSRPDRCRR
jgi:Asp-tRNA(Asn)/Glu-tRNA(Gln) amidotransferase A subunit family amidase